MSKTSFSSTLRLQYEIFYEKKGGSPAVMLLYLCLYLHLATQLIQGTHVLVYRSDCRYLPYSIHFSEFMPIFFLTRKRKHENTRSPPFLYDTKMTANGYQARSAFSGIGNSLVTISGPVYTLHFLTKTQSFIDSEVPFSCGQSYKITGRASCFKNS